MIFEVVISALLILVTAFAIFLFQNWFEWEIRVKKKIAMYKVGRLYQIAGKKGIDLDKIKDEHNVDLDWTEKIEKELTDAVKDIEDLKKDKE